MNHGEPGFFEDPARIRKIVIALYVLCGLLAAAGLLVHWHAHFDFEAWPAFYGIYGFLGYSFIVFSAKGLRKLIKRPEDYYDA
ncbi:MAG: hypothetical protein R3F20_05805 [Planctomycetota bacterium]